MLKRLAANRQGVGLRGLAPDRVDHEADLDILDMVHDVWPPFLDLVDRFDFHSLLTEIGRRATCGFDLKSEPP